MNLTACADQQPLSAPESTPQPSRHEWLWVALPLVVLAYFFVLLQHPLSFSGQGPAKLIAWTCTSTICFGVLPLALIQWLPLGAQSLRPRQALLMTGIPGLFGALSAAFGLMLPIPLTPAVIAQWMFLAALSVIMLSTLLRLSFSNDRRMVEQQLIASAGHARWRDYLALTKPGLNALVLVTTLVGYYMASPSPLNWVLCLKTVVGTALTAAGASVFNQFIERDLDGLMRRTADRPLPTRRLSPVRAFLFATLLAICGMFLLALTVNVLTGFLAALSLAIYLFVYTPLKRINTLSTLAGAISGALPPLLGWTGATGEIAPAAQVLFFILFLWQEPHFLAIGWKYREQYAAAGCPLYSVLDDKGQATGRQMTLYATVLLIISMLPTAFGITGLVYAASALLLGSVFVAFAWRFIRNPEKQTARAIFLTSIAYLPLLLIVMVIDKI